MGNKLVSVPGKELQMACDALKCKTALRRFRVLPATMAAEHLYQECHALYYPVTRRCIANVVTEVRKILCHDPVNPIMPQKRNSNLNRVTEALRTAPASPAFTTPTKRRRADPASPGKEVQAGASVKTPPRTPRSFRRMLEEKTTEAIERKRKRLVVELKKLGKMHMAMNKSMEANDGELTSLGISSTLRAAPALSVEALTETIYISEGPGSKLESLGDVCIRQHNSGKFGPIKTEMYNSYAMLGVSKGKLVDICRPSVKRIAALLKVPERQSTLSWAQYEKARDDQLELTRARFFQETKSSAVVGGEGAVYCHDRNSYACDMFGQAQLSMSFFANVVVERLKCLDPEYVEKLKNLQDVHHLRKIPIYDGTSGRLPIFYTGDACTMYQQDNTNVRFSQTEIAWMTPTFGTQSPFTLNPLLVYADKDHVKCLQKVLEEDARVRMTLDTTWQRLEVGGRPILPVFCGISGDTQFIWESLGRKHDSSWTKGLGGTFRDRHMFMDTQSNGMTTYFGAITYTARFLYQLHDTWRSIPSKYQKKDFQLFVMKEFGLDVTMESIYPGAGFENCLVGQLHLVGTASQNLMIDIAKIFDAAGRMTAFWDFLSHSCTDIGLKAKKASKTRSVRNFRPAGSTGQWLRWAIEEAEYFLLYKHPSLMTSAEMKDEARRHRISGWNDTLVRASKESLLAEHAAKLCGLPVGITLCLMHALHYWSRMCKVCTCKPVSTQEWKQYISDVARFDRDSHTWQSLWVALCGGPGATLKPTQLNIFHGTCIHLHRFAQAGLALAEVSDEWIEEVHHLSKTHLPLYHLYRSLDGVNNHIRTGDEVDNEDSTVGDGRCRLNVGQSMRTCLAKRELRKNVYLKNMYSRVRREHHDIGANDSTPTTAPVPVDADAHYGIDYAHRFERRVAFENSSSPPQYLTVTSAHTKTGRSCVERGVVKLELRFCFASRAIKLVRTDVTKHSRGAEGGNMLWEWDLHHLWRANVGTADDDGLCDVTLCFCSKPSFYTRKYSLGQRQWRTEMPPGFLAGLMYEPVVTLTLSEENIREALKQVTELNPEFAVVTNMDIIQSVLDSDDGYSMSLLIEALHRVIKLISGKYDNQSELVRTLRMPTSDDKQSSLEMIVSICDNIVRVNADAEYTHPMRCCCCGRWTELAKNGVRVLQTDRTIHYVCEYIAPYILEIEQSGCHPGFPTFRKFLLKMHDNLNS